jgi:SOS-response transcriptional repressor LexA
MDRTTLDVARALKLAKFLDVSLQWLVEGESPMRPQNGNFDPKRYAPIVNRVTAGNWNDVITPQDVPEDAKFLELSAKPAGFALALEIDGESMLPEFQPKDIIVIDTGLDPLPGDFVVAVLEGESKSTFKKFRPRGADEAGDPIIELAPLNADYPTLHISSRNPGRIVGTMIEHRRIRRRR